MTRKSILNWKRNFFLIAFLVVPKTSLAASKTVIRFPIEPEISHQAQYSLLDLVEVENPKEGILRQLSRAQIPARWTQGSRWSLSADQILSVLRQNRLSQRGVEILLPQMTQPRKSREILSAPHLKRVITLIAKAECKACEFKIDLHNIPKVLLSDWEWDPFSVKFRGSFTTLIKMPDSRWTGWLTGFVRWKSPVLITQKNISYQEKIQSNDVIESLRDITYSKDLITDPNEVIGLVAARAISPSTALSRGDLRKEPLVKRGQVVKTIMGRLQPDDSDFEVSVVAVAEENGVLGDVITVKNADSQKLLSATVIDHGVVRIK
ncbi:MAG: flagellar basal body P-ring formation protein FlgA [Bdellovibrionaceae bacterium]|nr:flagellar basal body P-ring formation protein FlgA [Pseudobdellovibrionaceae bacterium]